MTSGGNNFNDFPENQLAKFRAVYTVKVNLKYRGHVPLSHGIDAPDNVHIKLL